MKTHDINSNTSVLEYERLTQERNIARAARKAINKRRYERRHPAHFLCQRMVRVSDIVTVTIGPLSSGVSYPIDQLSLV